jgi:hypothetical protein
MLWPNTPVLRILPGRGRTQYEIALLDVLDNRLVLSRFEPPEGDVRSSGKEREDKKRQADAEEELHEHVGIYFWCGVSAVRHFGVSGLVMGAFCFCFFVLGRDSSGPSGLYLRNGGIISESDAICRYSHGELRGSGRVQRLLLECQRVVSEGKFSLFRTMLGLRSCDA